MQGIEMECMHRKKLTEAVKRMGKHSATLNVGKIWYTNNYDSTIHLDIRLKEAGNLYLYSITNENMVIAGYELASRKEEFTYERYDDVLHKILRDYFKPMVRCYSVETDAQVMQEILYDHEPTEEEIQAALVYAKGTVKGKPLKIKSFEYLQTVKEEDGYMLTCRAKGSGLLKIYAFSKEQAMQRAFDVLSEAYEDMHISTAFDVEETSRDTIQLVYCVKRLAERCFWRTRKPDIYYFISNVDSTGHALLLRTDGTEITIEVYRNPNGFGTIHLVGEEVIEPVQREIDRVCLPEHYCETIKTTPAMLGRTLNQFLLKFYR